MDTRKWSENFNKNRKEIPRGFWIVVLEEGRKMKRADKISNEGVLRRVDEERSVATIILRMKLTGLETSLGETA